MTYSTRQFPPLAAAALFALLHLPPAQAQTRIIEDGPPTLADLLQAEQLAGQCLGMALSADTTQASLTGNRLGVSFQPHETGPGLQRFFVGKFLREDIGEEWKPQVMTLHAAQTMSEGRGVHVTGLLEPATAELLYQAVTDLWTEILGPEFTITTINTTRKPELFCDYTTPIPEAEGVWHEVLVAGQTLPDEPVLPKYLYASGIVELGSTLERASAGHYKFTFQEDAGGYPEFVAVDCAMAPAYLCDEKLETLKTALGTGGEEDTTQRDAAIMAVLPPAYTKDHIREIQVNSGNGRESLVVQLEEVPASPARTVRGIAICRRPLASGGDWACEYRFVAYNQTLANGMTVSVRTLGLSEAQVETLVAQVADDIIGARIVSIGAADGGYTLNVAGFANQPLTARFDAGLNLVEKTYRDR